MNKQELIKHFENMPYVSIHQMGKQSFIDLIEQLDEPQKPIVQQFVADWYEDIADEFYVVLERLVLNYNNNTDMSICKWFFETEDALTILINMHQFGYTIEKEKRYSVKIKGEIEENLLVYGLGINRYFFARTYDSSKRNEHTRKELEDAGFEEVFNSPLFEVEEVG